MHEEDEPVELIVENMFSKVTSGSTGGGSRQSTSARDDTVSFAASLALPTLTPKFITVLRCFSNGWRVRHFVNMSAEFSSVPRCFTSTRRAPRSSRILNSLRSMWRVCWAEVKRWHRSCAPLGVRFDEDGARHSEPDELEEHADVQ